MCVAWGLACVDHTSQVWFSTSPDIARGLLPIPAIDNAKAAMHGIAYYWYCQFTARQLLLSSRNRYAAVIQHGVKQDTSSDRSEQAMSPGDGSRASGCIPVCPTDHLMTILPYRELWYASIPAVHCPPCPSPGNRNLLSCICTDPRIAAVENIRCACLCIHQALQVAFDWAVVDLCL